MDIYIPMEEVENENSASQVLSNTRTLIEKSVQKTNINLQDLTGIDTDDIKNLHSTLQEIISAMGE